MEFMLAGVIAVVDSVAGEEVLGRCEEARRQAAMADILLTFELDPAGSAAARAAAISY